MSIPTTEIIIFETSEEFRKDPSILSPGFDIVSKVDGAQMPVYCGLQIENPTTGYLFLNWDSLAHHQALIESPSYGSLLETLKPAFGGPMKMYHVIFNDHPIAFKQPVTEVLRITLKDPSHRAEVSDILSKISDMTKKMLVFGPTLENENEIILVGGWESVEVGVDIIMIWDVLMLLLTSRLIGRRLPILNRKLRSNGYLFLPTKNIYSTLP
ncbi:hypothetical protein DEU56DRAFT_836309 [Suillus clintonianus]|uniref:uncharacterized protein n=1 Tax=Suillus clintonianus TaxID=1904413 RepID=UPI001B85FA98|nr:uncharacterized protein DEU56DRAFT_836309 [Suillus clintonianus]KAG2119398.1 hypothetical protein DEU56DRAFT_836309 [Suillus clintonianus]